MPPKMNLNLIEALILQVLNNFNIYKLVPDCFAYFLLEYRCNKITFLYLKTLSEVLN